MTTQAAHQKRLQLLPVSLTGTAQPQAALQDKFWWPGKTTAEQTHLEMKHEALSMLLNGIDLKNGSMRAWFMR